MEINGSPMYRVTIRFSVWNIRGLNSPIKQKEVKYFIDSNNHVLVAILETKVREANVDRVRHNYFGEWNFVNNNDLNLRGRIWVAWDHTKIDVRIFCKLEQVIHCEVILKGNSCKCFCFICLWF